MCNLKLVTLFLCLVFGFSASREPVDIVQSLPSPTIALSEAFLLELEDYFIGDGLHFSSSSGKITQRVDKGASGTFSKALEDFRSFGGVNLNETTQVTTALFFTEDNKVVFTNGSAHQLPVNVMGTVEVSLSDGFACNASQLVGVQDGYVYCFSKDKKAVGMVHSSLLKAKMFRGIEIFDNVDNLYSSREIRYDGNNSLFTFTPYSGQENYKNQSFIDVWDITTRDLPYQNPALLLDRVTLSLTTLDIQEVVVAKGYLFILDTIANRVTRVLIQDSEELQVDSVSFSGFQSTTISKSGDQLAVLDTSNVIHMLDADSLSEESTYSQLQETNSSSFPFLSVTDSVIFVFNKTNVFTILLGDWHSIHYLSRISNFIFSYFSGPYLYWISNSGIQQEVVWPGATFTWAQYDHPMSTTEESEQANEAIAQELGAPVSNLTVGLIVRSVWEEYVLEQEMRVVVYDVNNIKTSFFEDPVPKNSTVSTWGTYLVTIDKEKVIGNDVSFEISSADSSFAFQSEYFVSSPEVVIGSPLIVSEPTFMFLSASYFSHVFICSNSSHLSIAELNSIFSDFSNVRTFEIGSEVVSAQGGESIGAMVFANGSIGLWELTPENEEVWSFQTIHGEWKGCDLIEEKEWVICAGANGVGLIADGKVQRTLDTFELKIAVEIHPLQVFYDKSEPSGLMVHCQEGTWMLHLTPFTNSSDFGVETSLLLEEIGFDSKIFYFGDLYVVLNLKNVLGMVYEFSNNDQLATQTYRLYMPTSVNVTGAPVAVPTSSSLYVPTSAGIFVYTIGLSSVSNLFTSLRPYNFSSGFLLTAASAISNSDLLITFSGSVYSLLSVYNSPMVGVNLPLEKSFKSYDLAFKATNRKYASNFYFSIGVEPDSTIISANSDDLNYKNLMGNFKNGGDWILTNSDDFFSGAAVQFEINVTDPSDISESRILLEEKLSFEGTLFTSSYKLEDEIMDMVSSQANSETVYILAKKSITVLNLTNATEPKTIRVQVPLLPPSAAFTCSLISEIEPLLVVFCASPSTSASYLISYSIDSWEQVSAITLDVASIGSSLEALNSSTLLVVQERRISLFSLLTSDGDYEWRLVDSAGFDDFGMTTDDEFIRGYGVVEDQQSYVVAFGRDANLYSGLWADGKRVWKSGPMEVNQGLKVSSVDCEDLEFVSSELVAVCVVAFLQGDIIEMDIDFTQFNLTGISSYSAYGSYLFSGGLQISEKYVLVQALRPEHSIGNNIPSSWSTILIFNRNDSKLAAGNLLPDPKAGVSYKSCFLFIDSSNYLTTAPFPSRVNWFSLSENSTRVVFEDVDQISSEKITVIARNDFGEKEFVIYKDFLKRSYLLVSLFAILTFGTAILAGIIEWVYVQKRRKVASMSRSRVNTEPLKESIEIETSSN